MKSPKSAPAPTIATVLRVVGPKPSLWITAFREARRFVPDEWWRSRPYLPVPDPAFLAFRSETQYGSGDHAVEPHDLEVWLRWCRSEYQRQRG